jgi:hypothetical protein
MYIPHDELTFYGEQGVHRRVPHIKRCGWFDEDYDRHNPDGHAWGRRNYDQSSYLSGFGDAYPDDYRPNFDFYSDYAHRPTGTEL